MIRDINLNKKKLQYKILSIDEFPNGPHFYQNINLDPSIIHFNYLLAKHKKVHENTMNGIYKQHKIINLLTKVTTSS